TIKTTELEYPVLEAVRVNNRLRVWCRYCAEHHHHSPEDGHRAAHCRNENSPFKQTGYIITEATSKRYKDFQSEPAYVHSDRQTKRDDFLHSHKVKARRKPSCICMMRNQKCIDHEHVKDCGRPNVFMDHSELFYNSYCIPALYTIQPYHMDSESLKELLLYCDMHGLEMSITDESYHADTTFMIKIQRKNGVLHEMERARHFLPEISSKVSHHDVNGVKVTFDLTKCPYNLSNRGIALFQQYVNGYSMLNMKGYENVTVNSVYFTIELRAYQASDLIHRFYK